MPDDRFPKKVLYGKLSEETRLPQGPKKRYTDQLKQSLKNCNLNPVKFEEDCHNRVIWQPMRFEGLSRFEAFRANNRELRRQTRHAARRIGSTNKQITRPMTPCSDAWNAAVCAGRELGSSVIAGRIG